jgi:hypothetical protein
MKLCLKNSKSQKILQTLPNCTNTLDKYYKQDAETVKKLEYFSTEPDSLCLPRPVSEFRIKTESTKTDKAKAIKGNFFDDFRHFWHKF